MKVNLQLLKPQLHVYLSYRAIGERSAAGFPPHQQAVSCDEYSASSPSLEKEDTVEGCFCRVLYIPKLKHEVEVGDLRS